MASAKPRAIQWTRSGGGAITRSGRARSALRYGTAQVVYKTVKYPERTDPVLNARLLAESRARLADELDAMKGVSRWRLLRSAKIIAVDEAECAFLKEYIAGVSFLEIEREGAQYGSSAAQLRRFDALYKRFAQWAVILSPNFIIPHKVNVFFDLETLDPLLVDAI